MSIDLVGGNTVNLGSTTANDNGAFSTTVSIPSGTPAGSFILRATCGSVVQDNTITVVATGGGGTGGGGGGGGVAGGSGSGGGGGSAGGGGTGGGGLPRTGAESTDVARLGALFVLGGVGLVIAAQQRRRVSERRGAATA